MSILINNDLIWVSVPKCASVSIERALLNSDLDIRLNTEYKYNLEKLQQHGHTKSSELFNEFGKKETVCITRDWFDRWLSGLEFVWQRLVMNGHSPKIQWEEIDNNFIYNTFDNDFGKTMYYNTNWDDSFNKLTSTFDESKPTITPILCVFMSQNYWKENQPCTYEFDIKEIHKFEEFIQKRYSVSFKIPHLNSTKKIKNKIEINDELKNYLWNVFENPFEKRNALI